MKTIAVLLLLACVGIKSSAQSYDDFTTQNESRLRISFIGHGTLMFDWNGKIIHIDPWSALANYDTLPKADYVFVTHHHGDHLDSTALSKVFTLDTKIYWSKTCAKQSRFKANAFIVANNDTTETPDFSFIAVPAYNIVHKRNNGMPFHPRGEGNGYIFIFDNLRVYVAGDTEDIPEMKSFGSIDIAFLPVNLPYTMSPEMFKSAVLMLKPKIVYPYHTGKTNLNDLIDLLSGIKSTEIRIRSLQ
ncbi:MAG: hypothetical protein PWR03_1859 [Tenuifilum sp.]|uniref:MBL fold metallo-hydrolase n=1 Tax=Tenuifilum sp. TaxID=2760880 RepID=UPI0024AA3697|nr:MBL fold metallo-hydrolase [Tenuifilum sp.]MDI3527676.1 hypothetical protein [Tenuifilum sp.]